VTVALACDTEPVAHIGFSEEPAVLGRIWKREAFLLPCTVPFGAGHPAHASTQRPQQKTVLRMLLLSLFHLSGQ